jgi:hypothetical protein
MTFRRLGVALFFAIASNAAQAQFDGTWKGTMMANITCPSGQAITQRAEFTLDITQTGSSVSLMVTITQPQDPCVAGSPITTNTFPFTGTVSGSTMTVIYSGGPLVGVVSGNTMALTLGVGAHQLSGTMIKQVPPTVDATGTWTGTYTSTSACDGHPVTSSGSVQLFAVQSGTAVNGTILVTASIFDCVGGPALPIAFTVSGTVSGNILTMTTTFGTGSLGTVMASIAGTTMDASMSQGDTTSHATLTRVSSTAPASSLSGSFTGSYTQSQLPCGKPPQTANTGSASASITQFGGGITGTLNIVGVRDYFLNTNGTCGFTTAAYDLFLSGQVSGSTIAGIAFTEEDSVPSPFSGTVNGNTISGTVIGRAIDNESVTFTITRSGSSSAAPQITSFSATPPAIRLGQAVGLSWSTASTTAVTIDNGIGLVQPSGNRIVSPTATTTYTLTAVQGTTATATATARVEVLTAPLVNVNSLPQSMLQVAGSAGGSTSYTLTNSGGAATSITLTQNGSFFTQSPTSFTLQPGASQTVTITGTAQTAGSYEGTSNPGGTGVPNGLQIAVKLLSATAPSGTVTADPTANRIDVSTGGSAGFKNNGTARLTGVLNSDQPWLIPQTGSVTIDPGQTATFTFTIDRTKRPDAASLAGSAEANLTLTFLSGLGSSFAKAPQQASGSIPSVSIVKVVDTVQPAVTTSGIPTLAAGEIGLIIPGVGHVTGTGGALFVSDVSVLNPFGGKSVDDVKFYYAPLTANASAARTTSLPSVQGQTSVWVADVVRNVFNGTNEVGTLHLRSRDADKLSVAATVLSTTTTNGTFGNAVPVFRSDRAAGAGSAIVLTGLRKDATTHTNLYVQEIAGSAAVAQIEFLAADGTAVGAARPADAIEGFRLLQLVNIVPANAVAAVITNNSTAGGRIVAYATPVDEVSGDTWAIADWSTTLGYTPTESVIIPVAGSVRGANNTFYRTDVAITNRGTSPASGALKYVSRTGSTIEKTISLGPRQSSMLGDVVGTTFSVTSDSTGYLMLTPGAGSLAIASRTFTTVGSSAGTFGTGVPALSFASALRAGGTKPIAGLSDASRSTVVAGRAGTFRTNFALMETSGAPVTVRVTFRFTFAAGAKTQGTGAASRAYAMNGNQFLLLNSIAGEILGPARLTYGDLTNVEADFQVISGAGAVMLFTSSVDNATGDSILRTE